MHKIISNYHCISKLLESPNRTKNKNNKASTTKTKISVFTYKNKKTKETQYNKKNGGNPTNIKNNANVTHYFCLTKTMEQQNQNKNRLQSVGPIQGTLYYGVVVISTKLKTKKKKKQRKNSIITSPIKQTTIQKHNKSTKVNAFNEAISSLYVTD